MVQWLGFSVTGDCTERRVITMPARFLHETFPHHVLKEMMEDTVELADRFPGLIGYDVVEHVQFVHDVKIHPDTCLYRAILAAYRNEDINAGMAFLH